MIIFYYSKLIIRPKKKKSSKRENNIVPILQKINASLDNDYNIGFSYLMLLRFRFFGLEINLI